MLRRLNKYYGKRNFFQSSICRNIEKAKPNESREIFNSTGGLKMDFAPTEMEKKILVWSGKFKSREDIPDRISYGTIEEAKSRFRIRVSNLMMVGTVLLCLYYVWKGKTSASGGQTLNKMFMEKYGKPSEKEQK